MLITQNQPQRNKLLERCQKGKQVGIFGQSPESWVYFAYGWLATSSIALFHKQEAEN